MSHGIHGRMGSHLRRLASQSGLAFAQVLTPQMVSEALERCGVVCRHRVFTPVVTLWAWMWQVLSDAHTCGEAVARVLTDRIAQGQAPCSANTGSYCQARQRLPLALLKDLVCQIGSAMQAQSPTGWLWKGRQVKVVDGTTVSMPDTPANQGRFPQSQTQKPGLGFPMARLVVVFSLATAAALDMVIGPCKGKQTGENSLFRTLMAHIARDEVVLGDRCFCSYCDVALLMQRGADVVMREHQKRKTDLRRAQRLGRNDHLVVWDKPKRCPEGLEQATFDQLPDQLTLRRVTVHVVQKGRRTRKLTLITTLLDPKAYPAADLAELYRQRWEVELDLRSLKTTLHMDVLRCLSPEMVEKELWVHLLAYNTVRLMMAQAAAAHQCSPMRLSFSGCLQLLRNFHAGGLLAQAAADPGGEVHTALLAAMAQRVLPDRPDRIEPRAVKRRPKPHPLLNVPRSEAREALK